VKIPGSKSINNTDHKLRDLLPIHITPSRLWMKLQFILNLIFVNLGFFALQPYFLSDTKYAFITGLLFWLIINFSFLIFFKKKKQREKGPSQISIKNGIWLVEFQNQHFYCELRSEIVCWQWIIIIPLYCPQSRKTLRIILLKDSLQAKDDACLRRWIHSQLT
jgi:hypothetical protein